MLNEQKVHSILLGRKVRKFYELPTCTEFADLREKSETLERVIIGEYELPLLEVKDEVFLSDKGVYATVQKVTAGTDGCMYYNVSYIVEYVDDRQQTAEQLAPEIERRLIENAKIQKQKDCEQTVRRQRTKQYQCDDFVKNLYQTLNQKYYVGNIENVLYKHLIELKGDESVIVRCGSIAYPFISKLGIPDPRNKNELHELSRIINGEMLTYFLVDELEPTQIILSKGTETYFSQLAEEMQDLLDLAPRTLYLRVKDTSVYQDDIVLYLA